jgi:hypothetical protein
MVPLDFREVILGRLRGSWGVRGRPSPWMEEDEEDAEEVELGISTAAAESSTVGSPDGDSAAIICCTATRGVQ